MSTPDPKAPKTPPRHSPEVALVCERATLTPMASKEKPTRWESATSLNKPTNTEKKNKAIKRIYGGTRNTNEIVSNTYFNKAVA